MDSFPEWDDPGRLFRYRDSIYATDLLICAITHLDFFSFLKDGAKTFMEICDKLKIEPRPADVLLSLLQALELVEKMGDRYGNTDLADKYLTSGNPDSLVPYYESLQNRPQCREFVDVLRTGKPAGWSSDKEGDSWLKSMEDRKFADAFTAAMDSRGTFFAKRLTGILDLSPYQSVLDVAGGSGIYACAMAARYDQLEAAVLELPAVADSTRRSLHSKGMTDRVRVVDGDMFEGLPADHDLHLYANVFHDWDMDSVRKLAANSFRSLVDGGRIVVFDSHLNDQKNGSLAVAEYSCLLMYSTVGRCYSTREISDILKDVGFTRIEVIEMAADRSAIIGNKN